MKPINNNKQKVKYRVPLLVACVFIIVVLGCEDFVEIDPPRTELVNETVFANDNTAIAAINGIYSEMIGLFEGFTSGGSLSVTYLSGLSADELDYFGSFASPIEFHANSLTVTNLDITNALWGRAYFLIFNANRLIEGLNNSEGVTASVRLQLEGEAKFIRAFCHFYLVNLFGNVPLVTSSIFQENNVASRNLEAQVYEQIIVDLKDAQNLLDEDYVTDERVRPNKSVATALLARVYLYTEDWVNAEAQATTVIENTASYDLLADLNSVFLANSVEAIWQLKPAQSSLNTNEGFNFVLTSSPVVSSGNVALTNQLQAAFELNDNRKVNWVNSYTDGTDTWYYPYKYKIQSDQEVTEYSMVLRVAEQYLIRAEARIWQGNIVGSQEDLNAIRNRAGLVNTPANDQASLLMAIEQERRVELFTEWGHRWLDLKRTDRADAVLSSVPFKDWQLTDVLYPIPQSELETNANLLPQNAGY